MISDGGVGPLGFCVFRISAFHVWIGNILGPLTPSHPPQIIFSRILPMSRLFPQAFVYNMKSWVTRCPRRVTCLKITILLGYVQVRLFVEEWRSNGNSSGSYTAVNDFASSSHPLMSLDRVICCWVSVGSGLQRAHKRIYLPFRLQKASSLALYILR